MVFQKEFIIEDSLPIPPYTQHHLLWMKIGLWYGRWWFTSPGPTIFSILHYCKVSAFHHLSQFVLKMEDITFKWRVACRNTVEKVCVCVCVCFLFFVFFWLTLRNPNIKAMNISNLVHRIFSPWFGYFEYVGNRLHDIKVY